MRGVDLYALTAGVIIPKNDENPTSVNLNRETRNCTFVLVNRVLDPGTCTYALYRDEVVTT